VIETALACSVASRTEARDLIHIKSAHGRGHKVASAVPEIFSADRRHTRSKADILAKRNQRGYVFNFSEAGGNSRKGFKMRVAKKTSISPNADRELDDETFMSAEQLRGYMNALMAAKGSENVGAMNVADKAKKDLIKTLSTPIDLTRERLKEIMTPLLHKLRSAAERGETELMVMRFPNELCTDKGRAINNAERSWPETLTGRPRQAYELWRDQLQPAGYRLTATIVEWPSGLPGDVGFFLSWGTERA
jgi:hypothetical protein